MNHFLVRLGKFKYAESIMPAVNCAVVSIYAGVHLMCHEQLRDFFAAQSPSGRREKISSHLRDLIQETHDLCLKNGFAPSDPISSGLVLPKSSIKWFASSTLEPISFGCTKLHSGVIVGLPSFYNFTKPEDIPDSLFDIKRLALFRSPQDETQEIKSKADAEKYLPGDQVAGAPIVRKIDRNSEEGEEYSKTLILSDDAKKFSIARELYLSDSIRVLLRAFSLFLSFAIAINVGRAFVKRLNLKQSHIANRIPFYLTSGLLGYGNDHFLSLLINQTYAKFADEKAMSLGPNYEAGAKEYFDKRARRNNILGIKQ